MTQTELARRALRAARTHLRLARGLMTLTDYLRSEAQRIEADVSIALGDLAALERAANLHLAKVRKARGR